MGLCVTVGMLAELAENDPESVDEFAEVFKAVNRLLIDNKLPPHIEPKSLPQLDDRCGTVGYPYSWLHYLRRAYAHRVVNPSWMAKTLPQPAQPAEDSVLRDVQKRTSSHLLCHSDAEGFYVPIDFGPVLFDRGEGVPGEMLGSSYRLREELITVAPALDIQLEEGTLPNKIADLINAQSKTQEGIWIERLVWLSLFEAARLSIEHRTAICFT